MTAKGKLTGFKIGGIILILLLLSGIFVFGINQWKVTVTVNGLERTIVEYGDVYVDEGATARFHGSLICKEGWPIEISKIDGEVNFVVTKKSSIFYYAEVFGIKGCVERIVTIVDTQAPEIILKQIAGHYTLPGQAYEEEGFVATDSCDGDLSEFVKREERNGKVYYTVEDSSGNKTEAVRYIFYDDPIAPELTLIGESELIVEAGEGYDELGFTAVDNVEGDITKLVQIAGSVDGNIVGIYTITYTVTDKYENSTSIQRVVQVVDTTAPELTLKGNKKIVLEAGAVFEDEYSAVDRVDGDLTNEVKVSGSVNTQKLGTYTLTYKVEDNSGNSCEVIRTVVVQDTTSPQITLKGEKKILLNIGTNYQEPGYSATDNLDGDITKSVKVTGTVDGNTMGTYTITYAVSDSKGNRSNVTRTIEVKDIMAPQLQLNGETNMFLFVGTDYEEAGYTAFDEYDGELTDAVKVSGSVNKDKIGTYTITYTVADKSGNTTMVKRTVRVGEDIPPELTLKGESTITIDAGSKYTEPGYSATDNYDGDITSRVKIEGSVNRYISGTYTLTYIAEDTSGNQTKAKRTVIVKAVPQPDTVTPDGKVIYLTFDDGPGKYTKRLLEVLDKYNVKVTFFTVKTSYAHLMAAQAQAGHTVAIHSATHEYAKIYASEDAYFADLELQQNLIEQYTGIRSTLVRFPGGSSNNISANYNKGIMTRLAKSLKSMGYQYFDWNVDSKDAGGAKTAQEVFENVINGVQKRRVSVVLQHDIYEFSVDAVEMIISWGLANGYTFLPMDATSPTAHHVIKN